MFIFPILLFFALIYRQVKKDLIISHEYHYFQPNTYHYKSKQDKLNLVQWVIQKSSNILDVFIISKISKNILTVQSKVFSHFTEKSVVRKHIKSDNQTDNEGEKSFLSALFHKKAHLLWPKLLLIWIFFVKSERNANLKQLPGSAPHLAGLQLWSFGANELQGVYRKVWFRSTYRLFQTVYFERKFSCSHLNQIIFWFLP